MKNLTYFIIILSLFLNIILLTSCSDIKTETKKTPTVSAAEIIDTNTKQATLSEEGLETLSEVNIGNLNWMTKNLSVRRFRNGDLIFEAKNEKDWLNACQNATPAYCSYKFDSTYDNTFGKYYNIFVILDKRELAPEGWKIASDRDWKNLTISLGGTTNQITGNSEQVLSTDMGFFNEYNNVGEKLKSSSQWNHQWKYKCNKVGCSGNGKNQIGFNAYPTGSARYFSDFGMEAKWWTKPENENANIIFTYNIDYLDNYNIQCSRSLNPGILEREHLNLYYFDGIVSNVKGDKWHHFEMGYPVRCVVSSETSNIETSEESNLLESVIIGDQEWTTNNLCTKYFSNGDQIPIAYSKEEWARYSEEKKPACCFYLFNETNIDRYGVLYNWYSVKDPRGLAPSGWHIPSNEEYKNLQNYLGKNLNCFTQNGQRHCEQEVCPMLKSNSIWKNPGNNSSGFNALPSIDIDDYGFFQEGRGSSFWTTTPSPDQISANCFKLNNDCRLSWQYSEQFGDGLGIRLVKD